jgi:glycosyltransferase involved in cell wall biosynthesis
VVIINSSDSNRLPVWKRGIKALQFALVSCRIAFKEPSDVIIASSGPITVGIPALAAHFLKRKKIVFEVRDLWPQGAIELGKIKNRLVLNAALWFEKICYKNSSLVVACSTGMESFILKRFPGTRTVVIPNASDPEIFSKSFPDFNFPDKFKNKKIFVYSGSLGIMDHGMLLIHAMKHVADNNIHLVILGEGAERVSMEAACRDFKMENVSFLGLVSKFEVAAWLSKSIAAIVVFKNFPVLQTSSPNKLFDAFAAGRPVIHNTTGWIRDLFEKENCGITVGPDDEKELAKAMEQLAGNNELRNEMAQNASRLAATVFNRDKLAIEYMNALIEAAG